MIDKRSAQWRALPWWFRAGMWGAYTRRHALWIEMSLLAMALISWMLAPSIMATPVAFLAAYLTGWIIRYGDNKGVW